jgi:hypothetical protein
MLLIITYSSNDHFGQSEICQPVHNATSPQILRRSHSDSSVSMDENRQPLRYQLMPFSDLLKCDSNGRNQKGLTPKTGSPGLNSMQDSSDPDAILIIYNNTTTNMGNF